MNENSIVACSFEIIDHYEIVDHYEIIDYHYPLIFNVAKTYGQNFLVFFKLLFYSERVSLWDPIL